MKKFLLACLMLVPLTVLADEYGINVPQWKDFCPTSFVDAKEPKGLGKFNVVSNYWYERRVSFENDLEECALIDEYNERFSCYEQLKVKQFKENSDYNARVEAKQNAASGIPEMQNRTDTMLPINNYLNGLGRFQANEIR